MQRDKLTADLKYFTTCLVHSILIVHFDASFNQHQHGNNLSALNAHMTILEYCEIQSWSHTDTELQEEIKGKEKHRLLIQLERKMYQEPNKQGMGKVNMMVTVTTTSKWHALLTTCKDRSYTSATSEKWCHEQYKHPFGHLKEQRPNAYTGDEYSDRLFKKETKPLAFQKTRRKQL
jgi:hypothetical protein